MVYYATISPNSPRYDVWIGLFGTDTVPLESDRSVVGTTPGLDGTRRFYRLAVDEFLGEGRDRIISRIARLTGWSIGLTHERIDGMHGVPILADDVTVSCRGEFFI